MKRILFSSFLLTSMCMSAQILVSEGFEGVSLPTGFESFSDAAHTYTRTPALGNQAGVACEGTTTVYMNLFTNVPNRDKWYFVYSSNLSNGTDLNYSFKYLAKKYNSSSTVNGTLSVEYSSDGGATWTVSTPDITVTDDTACTMVTGTIPGTHIPAGNDFKIRIVSKAMGGGDYYMGIDELSMHQVLSSPPATCTTMVTPTNGQVVNALAPVISYHSVVGATAYKISVGTTPGGTDIIDNEINHTLRYQVLPSANLQPNTI